MSPREQIELELWRFRGIKDHDKALEVVQVYIDLILKSAKELLVDRRKQT